MPNKLRFPPSATIAEINLANLRFNYRNIQQRVAPAEIIAVVKANAYGHGAVPVAQCLRSEGAKYFAVARLSEAMELLEAQIGGDILIFGTLFPEEMAAAIRHNIRITVTRAEDFETIDRLAGSIRTIAIVHVKIDTGMGRVGLPFDRAPEIIQSVRHLKNIRIEAVYTHFATADCRDKSFAYEQLARFQNIAGILRNGAGELPWLHAANSGAILDMSEAYFDLVRPGIALYGHYPTMETSESIPLRQVMTLKTKVAQIRELPGGTSISYGRRYFTKNVTRIAVLNVGYADGILRIFTNKGEVMIGGQVYPMVGTITMDQIMVEIGGVDIKTGDEVIFWGDSSAGSLQATRVAEKVGTIAYELCCAVGGRVPRVYLDR
jgi:alanine racemase